VSQPWRTWFADALQAHAGRAAAAALGATLVAVALLFHEAETVVVTAIPIGSLLAGAALLLPGVEEMRLGRNVVKTRAPQPWIASDVARMRELPEGSTDVDLPGDDEIVGARFRLGERCIEWLLADTAEELGPCEGRLFLYDEVTDRLLAAFRPPSDVEPIGFRPGQGVVGVAFETGDHVVATGRATHDDTYALTPEMQARYEHLTAVAATPVWWEDEVIGVVSLSTDVPEPRFVTEAGYRAHLELAAQLGVALVELLGLHEVEA